MDISHTLARLRAVPKKRVLIVGLVAMMVVLAGCGTGNGSNNSSGAGGANSSDLGDAGSAGISVSGPVGDVGDVGSLGLNSGSTVGVGSASG